MQVLDSTSWAGIIPIIQELPPVRDRREVPQPSIGHAPNRAQVPAFPQRTLHYAATRYSWTRPPSRSARWSPSALVNSPKVE